MSVCSRRSAVRRGGTWSPGTTADGAIPDCVELRRRGGGARHRTKWLRRWRIDSGAEGLAAGPGAGVAGFAAPHASSIDQPKDRANLNLRALQAPATRRQQCRRRGRVDLNRYLVSFQFNHAVRRPRRFRLACLIQRATVAVVTLSPNAGTTISVATARCLQAEVIRLPKRFVCSGQFLCAGRGDQLRHALARCRAQWLPDGPAGPYGCVQGRSPGWRRRHVQTNTRRLTFISNSFAAPLLDPAVDKRSRPPCWLWFLLAPHQHPRSHTGASVRPSVVFRERIHLLQPDQGNVGDAPSPRRSLQ